MADTYPINFSTPTISIVIPEGLNISATALANPTNDKTSPLSFMGLTPDFRGLMRNFDGLKFRRDYAMMLLQNPPKKTPCPFTPDGPSFSSCFMTKVLKTVPPFITLSPPIPTTPEDPSLAACFTPEILGTISSQP